MLPYVQDVRDRRVLHDRHRLVEAVLHVGEVGLDLCGSDTEEVRQLPHHLRVLLGGHARQRDVLGDLVAHHHVAAPVEDEAPRCRHLDVADAALRNGLGETLGVEHLEIPKPDEHE